MSLPGRTGAWYGSGLGSGLVVRMLLTVLILLGSGCLGNGVAAVWVAGRVLER